MNDLTTLKIAGSQALESVNRPVTISKGIVTTNVDPENLRRIRVTVSAMPGIDSWWLSRLKMIPGLDAPLPKIGSTVLVFYEEENPLKGFYIQIENPVTPPQNKGNNEDDLFLNVSGIIQIIASNNVKAVLSGDTVTLDGNVVINGNLTLNGNLSITGSASINGKQIATVGAKDNRGDILIDSGW